MHCMLILIVQQFSSFLIFV